MLKELQDIVSKPKELERLLKRFDIKISNRNSLAKIREGFSKIDGYIRNKADLETAVLSLCGSFQKLEGLGIDLNESDSFFVSGYKNELKADYEYTALLRAAAKNGFLALTNIIFVKKEEKFATIYDPSTKENLIKIDYRDEGLPKHVTLDTIKDYKFFFCLLTLKDNEKPYEIVHQKELKLFPEEVVTIKSKTKTQDTYDIKRYNPKTQRKEVVDQRKSVWNEFTRQMIEKTLIKQCFRLLKDVLPWVKKFYEFEEESNEYEVGESNKTEGLKDKVPNLVVKNADLNNPTEEQLKEAKQIQEEYKNSPIMKETYTTEIKNGLNVCKTLKDYQSFIDTFIIKILSLNEDKELLKAIKTKEDELSLQKIENHQKQKEEEQKKELPKNINIAKGVPKDFNKDNLDKNKTEIFNKLKADLESCETIDELRQCFENHKFQEDFAKLDINRKDLIVNSKNCLKEQLTESK